MQATAAGSASSVKEERLLLLIAIQDTIELPVRAGSVNVSTARTQEDDKAPMREKPSSSKKHMGFSACHFFEAFEKGFVDTAGAELRRQLVIVDSDLCVSDKCSAEEVHERMIIIKTNLFPVYYGALDIPRCHFLI
jgi:hypothetical protein